MYTGVLIVTPPKLISSSILPLRVKVLLSYVFGILSGFFNWLFFNCTAAATCRYKYGSDICTTVCDPPGRNILQLSQPSTRRTNSQPVEQTLGQGEQHKEQTPKRPGDRNIGPRRCFNCSKPGHFAWECQSGEQRAAVVGVIGGQDKEIQSKFRQPEQSCLPWTHSRHPPEQSFCPVCSPTHQRVTMAYVKSGSMTEKADCSMQMFRWY